MFPKVTVGEIPGRIHHCVSTSVTFGSVVPQPPSRARGICPGRKVGGSHLSGYAMFLNGTPAPLDRPLPLDPVPMLLPEPCPCVGSEPCLSVGVSFRRYDSHQRRDDLRHPEKVRYTEKMALTGDQPLNKGDLRFIRDIDAEPEPRRSALKKLVADGLAETRVILEMHDPEYQE